VINVKMPIRVAKKGGNITKRINIRKKDMENKTWQERFEESWKFGIDDKQRKASVKYLVSQLLQEEREKRIEHCGEIQCPECNKEAYTAGLHRALEVLPKPEEEAFGVGGGAMFSFGFNEALDKSRSAITEELKCIKQTNK
jgi:hypothetical protein